MGRPLRIGLVVGAIAAGYAATRLVAAWRQERRNKNVFPAAESRLLLQPLRHLVMPVQRTLTRFGLSPGQTVVEIGPGPGYYTIDAARIVGSGGRVVCLDIQREMLSLLADRLADHGVTNADLVVAEATHLPLRAGCADTAFMVTVLGEVPDPDVAIHEVRRVLRAGGTAGFAESFGDPDYVRAGTLRRMCASRFAETGHWRGILSYTSRFRALPALLDASPQGQ